MPMSLKAPANGNCPWVSAFCLERETKRCGAAWLQGESPVAWANPTETRTKLAMPRQSKRKGAFQNPGVCLKAAGLPAAGIARPPKQVCECFGIQSHNNHSLIRCSRETCYSDGGKSTRKKRFPAFGFYALSIALVGMVFVHF